MDIATLTAFLRVADTGSFSQAAEELFITQPAISKRINSLEQTVNQKLFDRSARHVNLTEAGIALRPVAQRILNEMAEAQHVLANLSNEVGGRLSIASSHHIGIHRLPEFLRLFKQQHQDVQLDIHFLKSEEAFLALERREVELAFITLPRKQYKQFAQTLLWRDDLAFVAAADHPLARKKSLRLNELAYTDAILPEPDTITWQIVDALFTQHKLPLKTAIPVNYLETIKMLVAAGLGWSVLPRHLLHDQSHLKLSELKVETTQLHRNLGVVMIKDKTLSNAATALIKLIQAI